MAKTPIPLFAYREGDSFYRVLKESEPSSSYSALAELVKKEILRCLHEYTILNTFNICRYLDTLSVLRKKQPHEMYKKVIKFLVKEELICQYARQNPLEEMDTSLPNNNPSVLIRGNILNAYTLSDKGALIIGIEEFTPYDVASEEPEHVLERLSLNQFLIGVRASYKDSLNISLIDEPTGYLADVIKLSLVKKNQRVNVFVMVCPKRDVNKERLLSKLLFLNRHLRLTESDGALILFICSDTNEIVQVQTIFH